MSMDDVLDLDLLTFGALVEVLLRVDYREKTEAAWTMMIAMQGKEKDMKKWTNHWARLTTNKSKKNVGSAADFLRDYGGGI